MKNYKFEPYSGTIRKLPENYWVCSVKDGKLVFDSWESMITEEDKKLVSLYVSQGLLKVN